MSAPYDPQALAVLMDVVRIDGACYVRAEDAHRAVTEARQQERDAAQRQAAEAMAEVARLREACYPVLELLEAVCSLQGWPNRCSGRNLIDAARASLDATS